MERDYELETVSRAAVEADPSPASRPEQASTPAQKLPQYIAAIAATLCGAAGGVAECFPIPSVLPEVLQEPFFTFADHMWIRSLFLLGAAVGAPFWGVLAQTRGRKVAAASLALPLILSWALLLATHAVPAIYAARILAGLGLGGVHVAVPIYLAEIADDRHRGALGALLQVMYLCGAVLPAFAALSGLYWLVNASCLVVTVVSLGAALWMPETPQFLEAKGRHVDADCSLRWLRGQQGQVPENTVQSASWKSRTTRRAFFVSLGLVALQERGTYALVWNETFLNLYQVMYHQQMDSLITYIFMYFFIVVAAIITMVIVHHWRRRILLLVSSAGMSIAVCLLGFHIWLREENHFYSNTMTFLAVLTGFVAIATYCVGLGSLTWVFMAEILPPNINCVAASLVVCTHWLIAFVDQQIYWSYFRSQHILLLVRALPCVASALFVAFLVPETKGKSLKRIQEDLAGKLIINPMA